MLTVCIQFALEELKPLEILNAQGDIRAIVHQIEQARSLKEHADLWLAHLATLDAAHRETVFERTIEKRKRSMQATQAAKKLRTQPTTEMVAAHFKANPNKLQKTLVLELTELYNVSPRTIATRLKDAKTYNLMQ